MRAFKNLREFLQLLDSEKQLLRITDEVNLEPDLAAAGRAITQLSETSPAIHFDHIKGYNKAQVVLNVHGSWTNQALMLGMEKDAPLREQFFEFVRRYEQFPGEIERRNSAPWQEMVVDKNVNLYDLMPLFRFNRGDGGFYIDKACIVSRDSDDWNNDDMETVGTYRLQVKGKNRLASSARHRHPPRTCRATGQGLADRDCRQQRADYLGRCRHVCFVRPVQVQDGGRAPG
jgi:4-hydroxybenzoate decarboxylase